MNPMLCWGKVFQGSDGVSPPSSSTGDLPANVDFQAGIRRGRQTVCGSKVPMIIYHNAFQTTHQLDNFRGLRKNNGSFVDFFLNDILYKLFPAFLFSFRNPLW